MLILILTVGSVQNAFAIDLEQIHPAANCHFSLSQSPESSIGNSNENSTNNYCQDLSVCVAHYNCAPLLPSVLSQLPARVLVQLADLAGNAVVSTRYPRLFKRPPKV